MEEGNWERVQVDHIVFQQHILLSNSEEENATLKESAMGFRILLICALFSLNYFSISAKFCYGRFDSSCDPYQVCCNNECVYGSNCNGQYCILDSDCSLNQVCCGNTCSYSCDTVGVVVGAVFGVIGFICLISLIVCLCIRRRRRLYGRPVVGQRIITARTTTTTQNYNPRPNYPQQGAYQGQQPYGYQQGYAQPPPPYAGYGATNSTAGPNQQWQSGSNVPPPNYSTSRPPYEEAPATVTPSKQYVNQKASAPPM